MAAEEWICIGKRQASKGGLATFFLTPDGQEKGYVFKARHVAHFARPGMVFSIIDGKFGGYVRTEKSERVEQWIVESEAVEAHEEADRRSKKAAEQQTIKLMVEPIRQVYDKCITPAQRRAVLMSVMEAITR